MNLPLPQSSESVMVFSHNLLHQQEDWFLPRSSRELYLQSKREADKKYMKQVSANQLKLFDAD